MNCMVPKSDRLRPDTHGSLMQKSVLGIASLKCELFQKAFLVLQTLIAAGDIRTKNSPMNVCADA